MNRRTLLKAIGGLFGMLAAKPVFGSRKGRPNVPSDSCESIVGLDTSGLPGPCVKAVAIADWVDDDVPYVMVRELPMHGESPPPDYRAYLPRPAQSLDPHVFACDVVTVCKSGHEAIVVSEYLDDCIGTIRSGSAMVKKFGSENCWNRRGWHECDGTRGTACLRWTVSESPGSIDIPIYVPFFQRIA